MARIELSNIGGGGTTLSLTTTGTSGASTLAGSVLNIPIYQGQLTLTTTGTSGAATLSGDILNIPNYATGGTPAGSAGEVQFNSTPAGSFAASSNLAWDNAAVQLNIGAPSAPTARFNIKGSGTLAATTSLRITNSSNTELARMNDAGSLIVGAIQFNGFGDSVSSTGQGFASPAANRTMRMIAGNNNNATDVAGVIINGGTISNRTASSSFQGVQLASDLQSPAGSLTSFTMAKNSPRARFGLTTYIGYDYDPTLDVAPTNHYAAIFRSGLVGIGLSAPNASIHVRGSNTSSGTNALLVQNSTPSDIYKIENNGKISYLATNTAAGTTGAQTIDRPSGTVNFAIGASVLVVTNSLCTTSSIVFATVRTNDATATIKNVVPAAGSFTINLGAGATAETSVGFFIIN